MQHEAIDQSYPVVRGMMAVFSAAVECRLGGGA